MKVATWNNLMKKLSNTKWGCNALLEPQHWRCYSATEYAGWARSPHASRQDPELNDACRSITGCLRPTNLKDIYPLAGITPHAIRRYVCARVQKKKQETMADHSLHDQIPTGKRWKGECFINLIRPADFSAKVILLQ